MFEMPIAMQPPPETPIAQPSTPPAGLTPSRRVTHWTMLIAATVVLLLSYLLTVVPPDRVAFRGFESQPLPPSCAFRTLFDKNCPGCGLTRSFIYLAHGDWHSAWQMHRLGWLLFAVLLLQFPYRIAALISPTGKPLGSILPKLFGYSIIALLIVNWVTILVTSRAS